MFIYRRLKPRKVSQLGGQKSLLTITQVAALSKAQRLSRRTFKAPGALWDSLNRSGLQLPLKTLGARADTMTVAPGSAARAPGGLHTRPWDSTESRAAKSTDHKDAPQPPQARRRRHHGREEQSPGLWTTVTQGQGGDIASPQSRLLGSRTENLAHLRPESQTGASPPLGASAAIFRGSLVCSPASGTAP